MNRNYDANDSLDVARLLSIDAVCRLTSRSRASVYRAVDAGSFPCPVKVGAKANGWRAAEVLAWIDSRPRRKAAV